VFAFLCVKANSREICQEISFPSFFRKMLMSAFLLRFKANYPEKMRGYPNFSSNSPCKYLLFPPGLNLAQKPLYLVGTVLKTQNRRPNNIQKASPQSYKSQIKILPFSGLA